MTPFAAAPGLVVRILGETTDPDIVSARRHAAVRAAARRRRRRQPTGTRPD